MKRVPPEGPKHSRSGEGWLQLVHRSHCQKASWECGSGDIWTSVRARPAMAFFVYRSKHTHADCGTYIAVLIVLTEGNVLVWLPEELRWLQKLDLIS